MTAMSTRSRMQRRRRRTVLVALCALLALTVWRLAPGIHSGQSSTSGAGLPPGASALDPAEFADGACIALAPTSGDRHESVFLDAGHGGIDPGAVGVTESGRTVYEADETLPVELDAAALLRAQGIRVVVSRTRDSTVTALGPGDESGGVLTLRGSHDDVAARDVCADLAHAEVLVGIYFDAGASEGDAGSIAAYDTARPFWSRSLDLATLVEHDVLERMNSRGWDIPDDGVVTDESLGSYVGSPQEGGIAEAAASYDHLLLIGPSDHGFFSTPSTMPGTVVEPLFLTDPFEASLAAASSGQHTIAAGIADAVEQFLIPAHLAQRRG
jgi:N-acetylmuramoyl-L-alanine amidase